MKSFPILSLNTTCFNRNLNMNMWFVFIRRMYTYKSDQLLKNFSSILIQSFKYVHRFSGSILRFFKHVCQIKDLIIISNHFSSTAVFHFASLLVEVFTDQCDKRLHRTTGRWCCHSLTGVAVFLTCLLIQETVLYPYCASLNINILVGNTYIAIAEFWLRKVSFYRFINEG